MYLKRRFVGIIAICLVLFPLVQGAFFYDSVQSDFDQGIYNRVFYNSSGFVQLNATFNSGNFTSRIFDAGANVSWQSFSRTIGRCYGCELPNLNSVEHGFVDGNANMIGNVFLAHFNETSGTLYDLSGRAANGTPSSGVVFTATGKLGRALDFEINNGFDFVNFSNHTHFNPANDQITIEAWVRPESLANGEAPTIIDKDYLQQYSFYFVGQGDVLQADLVTSNGFNRVTGTFDHALATWYHVVFTYNGSEMRLYNNGVPDGTPIAHTGMINASTKSLLVGSGWNGNSIDFGFDGMIDEIAMYNRSLNASEVFDHYMRGATRFNMSVRSCNDAACAGESFIPLNNTSPQNLTLSNGLYFQYLFALSRDSGVISPNLYNITLEYAAADSIAPSFSEFSETPNNGSSYNVGEIYTFNVTAIDDVLVNSVGLEFNGVNYTSVNRSSIYSAVLSDLAAGTYSYYWWANDSAGNYNTSDLRNYTVGFALGNVTLFINGLGSNISLVYPTPSNLSTYGLYGSVFLYIDGNDATFENGLNVTRGAGYYNITAISLGDQNHSSAQISYWLNVTRATPNIGLLLNGLNSNITLIYGQLLNASANSSGGTIALYRDNIDVTIENNQEVVLGAGVYMYGVNVTGNQNYSDSLLNIPLYVIIERASSEVFLYLNHSRSNINVKQGAEIALNSSLETGSGTIHVFVNGSVSFEGNGPSYNLTLFSDEGVFNVSSFYNGSQNYTGSHETWFVTVSDSDTTPPLVTIFSPANTIYSSSSILFNVSLDEQGSILYSLDEGIVNYTMDRTDGLHFEATNTTMTDGSYNVRFYANDSSGNLNATEQVGFVIDSTGPSLLIYSPQNITYSTRFIDLNYSVNDTYPSSCWYTSDLGVTNTSVGCGNNVTGLEANEGGNIWKVYGNDSAGNEGFASVTFNVASGYNNTLPLVTYNGPLNGSVLTTNYALLNITVYDHDMDNFSVIFYGNGILLGNFSNQVNGTTIGYNWSSLISGSYNWTVVAFDGSDNSSELYQFFDVAVNGTTPVISIVSPGLCSTFGTNNTIALNFSVNGTNIDSCWYSLNGGPNVSLPLCANSTFGVSGDGLYDLEVFAHENISGLIGSAHGSLSVSLESPTIIIDRPSNNSYHNNSVIELSYFTESYNGENTSRCDLLSDFGGIFGINQTNLSVLSGAHNSFFANLSEGVYDWSIACENAVKNSSLTCNYTLTSDVTPPNITIFEPNGTYPSGNPIPVTFNVTDNLSPITLCTYNLTFSLGGASVEIGVLGVCNNTFITINTAGNYNLTLGANDAAGNNRESSTGFSVSDSSSGNNGGGDGGSGGGGGGSGGGGGGVSRITLIESEGLSPLTVRPGSQTNVKFNLVNRGTVFLNNCTVTGKGSYRTWASSKDIVSMSPGEHASYTLGLSVPRDARSGEHHVNLSVLCLEMESSLVLPLVVVSAEFDFSVESYIREDGNLRVSYTAEDLTGQGSNLFVTYVLRNAQGIEVTSGSFSRALGAFERTSSMFEFVLPKDSFGEFVLELDVAAREDTLAIEHDVFLSGTGVTGLAISDTNLRTLSYWGIAALSLGTLFFVCRYLWLHHHYTHDLPRVLSSRRRHIPISIRES